MLPCAVDIPVPRFMCLQSAAWSHVSANGKAVCGSIRNSAGTVYESACVRAPQASASHAVQFTVTGLSNDEFTFTAVTWDDRGKKAVVHNQFTVTGVAAAPTGVSISGVLA